jgi:hypothetical protein
MNSIPTPKWMITIIILFLMALCVILISVIISGWSTNEQILWSKIKFSSEQKIILLVAIAGALGAFIHIATSFTDFIGSQKFEPSWIPWYFMRPFIGAALALSFYFLLRGGLISVNADVADQYSVSQDSTYVHYDTTGGRNTILRTTKAFVPGFHMVSKEKPPFDPNNIPPINPFGVTAISLLAGLFSRQAVDKLKEVFENLFMTKEKVDRKDPLKDKDENATTDTATTVNETEEEPVG